MMLFPLILFLLFIAKINCNDATNTITSNEMNTATITCYNATSSFLNNNNECQYYHENLFSKYYPLFNKNTNTIRLSENLEKNFTLIEKNISKYEIDDTYFSHSLKILNKTNDFYIYHNRSINLHNFDLNNYEYCIVNFNEKNYDKFGILSCTNEAKKLLINENMHTTMMNNFYNRLIFTIIVISHIFVYLYSMFLIPGGNVLFNIIRMYNVIFCILILTWITYYNTYLTSLAIINHCLVLLCFFVINAGFFEAYWTSQDAVLFVADDETINWNRKRFFYYKIYAFGSSFIIVGLSLLMTYIFNFDLFKSKYRIEECWFMNTNAKYYYLFYPIVFTMVINVYSFMSTATRWLICTNHGEENILINHKNWFKIYLILYSFVVIDLVILSNQSTFC